MKKGLETLYTLQQNDDNIKELENTIREIPTAVKRIENERDGKVSIIESAKTKLSENIKEREKLEKEISLLKEKIKKYKEQMGKSTTNKEYQGFIAEIKFEEDNILGVEEKIIEKMVESDAIMDEIRESEAEFNKIADEYNDKIKELDAVLNEKKTKLSEALKKRGLIRKDVPGNLLDIYDQLSPKKGGKAVSYVDTDFCGICNVKVRPQRLSEIISMTDMFFCENCGRILYKKIEENKDNKEDTAKKKEPKKNNK
ncbi:MAG: C4-type zinc ribbon domain-containing protein [Candidatus Aminicenantes bacterium]|nr:C4-type zinc ribbon domain-containing protein [Candidatus Aminicenantes bacterium]